MASKKYKVEQNGQFLGHHTGSKFSTVVQKAIDKYGVCYHINSNDNFILTRGIHTYSYNPQEDSCVEL